MAASVLVSRRPEGTRLELLVSAATAHCALQRLAQQAREPLPDVHAEMDGHRIRITAAQQASELDELEHAVIATRRLLGWRR